MDYFVNSVFHSPNVTDVNLHTNCVNCFLAQYKC